MENFKTGGGLYYLCGNWIVSVFSFVYFFSLEKIYFIYCITSGFTVPSWSSSHAPRRGGGGIQPSQGRLDGFYCLADCLVMYLDEEYEAFNHSTQVRLGKVYCFS